MGKRRRDHLGKNWKHGNSSSNVSSGSSSSSSSSSSRSHSSRRKRHRGKDVWSSRKRLRREGGSSRKINDLHRMMEKMSERQTNTEAAILKLQREQEKLLEVAQSMHEQSHKMLQQALDLCKHGQANKSLDEDGADVQEDRQPEPTSRKRSGRLEVAGTSKQKIGTQRTASGTLQQGEQMDFPDVVTSGLEIIDKEPVPDISRVGTGTLIVEDISRVGTGTLIVEDAGYADDRHRWGNRIFTCLNCPEGSRKEFTHKDSFMTHRRDVHRLGELDIPPAKPGPLKSTRTPQRIRQYLRMTEKNLEGQFRQRHKRLKSGFRLHLRNYWDLMATRELKQSGVTKEEWVEQVTAGLWEGAWREAHPLPPWGPDTDIDVQDFKAYEQQLTDYESKLQERASVRWINNNFGPQFDADEGKIAEYMFRFHYVLPRLLDWRVSNPLPADEDVYIGFSDVSEEFTSDSDYFESTDEEDDISLEENEFGELLREKDKPPPQLEILDAFERHQRLVEPPSFWHQGEGYDSEPGRR